MDKREIKIFLIMAAIFLLAYNLPLHSPRIQNAFLESLSMLKEYARLHVIFCLLPAMFIAGAISIFISKGAILKYLGAGSNKILAYAVASVSGAVLAVCSCTILPLFSGIYKRGAGLGPATAFLYAGPAINVLAIILTARVLGMELGIARALGAIIFSIVIGVIMSLVFKNHDLKADAVKQVTEDKIKGTPSQHFLFIFSLVMILIFANWMRPLNDNRTWSMIFNLKWIITAFFAVSLFSIMMRVYKFRLWKTALIILMTVVTMMIFPGQAIITFSIALLLTSILLSREEGELGDWLISTWDFTKQILPLLFIGVLISGFLLGRPGQEGIIPSSWIVRLVGSNNLLSNLFAAVVGAFMYFATLTEVPILQGLLGNGMSKGPALALLLAGPALSLPNMLVIRSVMGTKKTVVFISLVVVMATITGTIFGKLFQ